MQRHFILPAAATFALLGSTAMAQVEITWWHGMGGQLGEVVNEIATGFNESQDEYTITPVFRGSYEETLTAAIAAFRAGEQPNVVQVFDAGAATVIGAQGATIPVQDLLEQNGAGFDIEAYIPGVRYFYADTDGKMIGMPFNSSSPVLYYNETALEEAGVEVPQTYEDFEQIAPALRDAGYIPLVQTHLPWEMVENFHSRHDLPFATNDNGYEGAEGTEILIDSPEMAMHFTKLKEWLDAGLFGFYGTSWDDNQARFNDGEAAMYIGSSGDFGGLTAMDLPFEFGSSFLPYWESITPEGYQTFIGGASLFAMSGHSEEENAATAAFFEYLTSPEVQYMWHRETGYVPITEAAYEMAREDGHYDRFPAAETAIRQLSLQSGENTAGYRMGFYVQIRDVMNRELSRFLNGETDIEAALATIETEGNELLGRFSQTLSN
ncbi:extracellular solute-binding protein [Wenxinia saemankumensis]|uniref:sn-glycerol-3-phosphate-binding periplasmic protein UgpB n=1 Tax=Wenxinia saemankumensis TaxID=1447782 RepID=A0A1M6HUD2_9RHOB|nr:extracellular solute-binding protein [Wenxinia saemankumensis]SHJ25836.1 carbohydrate ABC transporter substrate-binding protein, CUT1 family [Wenxinia saemankumensis]